MLSLFLIVGVVLVNGGVHAAVDLTVTDKATGSDVVETVVDLIQQSCIFADDKLLLRRIASVETQDGVSTITFTHDSVDYYGGIWQVSSTDFTVTKTSASTTVYGQIKTVFGIDWSSVQYADLVKPLYSGLAARLKIDAYYGTETIPQTVDAQADYWSVHYTSNGWGTSNTTALFVSASITVTSTCESPKADIVFVLDGSGSIGATNFVNVRSFVEQVVMAFNIGPANVRVGLIEFSDTASAIFNLTTYGTKAAIENAVINLPYFMGGTNSAEAIKAMQVMVDQQGRQDDGVPVVCIFMTDGKSNNPTATAAAANSMHAAMPDVAVFAVGVGAGADVNELATIASKPSCLYVYQLSSFNDVTSFTSQILDQSCKVPAQLLPATEVSGTVVYNQYYYFKITVHKQKKGVKIQVKSSSGGVKTYFSWKVNNPSPALYDFTGDSDDTMEDGAEIHIPWDDSVSYDDDASQNTTQSGDRRRRRRDVPEDATGTVYGAVVGAQNKDNAFQMSYTDSAVSTVGGFLVVLLASLATVYLQY